MIIYTRTNNMFVVTLEKRKYFEKFLCSVLNCKNICDCFTSKYKISVFRQIMLNYFIYEIFFNKDH